MARRRMIRCAMCRCARPLTWFVPTIVWEHYIPPEHRRWILCFSCWKELTARRDNRAFEAAHGRPLGWSGGYPIEWETGKTMAPERWVTHWPKDYPSERDFPSRLIAEKEAAARPPSSESTPPLWL
jgi:hypothetical protein